MDSFIASAINIASGGWDNVKVTGIYNTVRTTIPTWKLGICQVTQYSYNGAVLSDSSTRSPALASAIASPASVLIAPGNIVTIGNGGSASSSTVTMYTYRVTFNASSIEMPSKTETGWWCAILFTW